MDRAACICPARSRRSAPDAALISRWPATHNQCAAASSTRSEELSTFSCTYASPATITTAAAERKCTNAVRRQRRQPRRQEGRRQQHTFVEGAPRGLLQPGLALCYTSLRRLPQVYIARQNEQTDGGQMLRGRWCGEWEQLIENWGVGATGGGNGQPRTAQEQCMVS